MSEEEQAAFAAEAAARAAAKADVEVCSFFYPFYSGISTLM